MCGEENMRREVDKPLLQHLIGKELSGVELVALMQTCGSQALIDWAISCDDREEVSEENGN